MLRIKKRPYLIDRRTATGLLGVVMLLAGLYVISLLLTPAVGPIINNRPINVSELPKPNIGHDRIIIPRIGVNIPFKPGDEALNQGAQWRFPERGNPSDGGNFIIAAHRLTIRPTHSATWEKSSFYHVDKLETKDKIIVDYNGQRYAYEVSQQLQVAPNQTEIEAPSDQPRLTLYTCTLNGAADGRVVLISKLLGQVAINEQ